jgi:hypothetical protein
MSISVCWRKYDEKEILWDTPKDNTLPTTTHEMMCIYTTLCSHRGRVVYVLLCALCNHSITIDWLDELTANSGRFARERFYGRDLGEMQNDP